MAKLSRKKTNDMTIDELASLCGHKFSDSRVMSTIVNEREASLKSYNSDKYGNESHGLSQFVTSDVRDVIEWTLPQLMEIFYGSDCPVVFEPINSDDVDQAMIETEYCANVLQSQNEGFLNVYTWFKDALVQKNGVIKVYWDERVEKEREEYRDKTLEEFEIINNDPDFTIEQLTIEVGTDQNVKKYSEDEFAELLTEFTDPEAQMMMRQAATVQIVGVRENDVSQIRIENIPPERFMIDLSHKSVNPQDCDYTAEVYTKTRSELIEEGYDEETVMALKPVQNDEISMFSSESITRNADTNNPGSNQNSIVQDEASVELVLVDHYIRADFDGDGIAEMRLVRTNGHNGEVIDNLPVDRNVYHVITPYINTHQFYGRSLADNMMDLQKMKTQTMRGVLDNLMYSVIPRKKVTGNVNIDDLLSYVPGGVIRMGDNGSVENDVVPFVAGDGISIVNTIDTFRSERTGFSRDSMGLNPQSLSNSTNMVGTMIMNQSQLLVKMIASIFANTGFNSMMLHIRELAAKYEKKERIFDVAGKYVATDPRSWRKKRSSRVKTGIGYSAKAEKMAVLKEFLDLQKDIASSQGGLEGPLTSNQGFYRLLDDIARTSGVVDGIKYFRDPETYQPPESGPTIAEESFKLQIEKLRNDQIADEAEKLQEMKKFNAEMDFKREQLDREMDWEAEKFDREMLYKYSSSSREGLREFLNSGVIERLGLDPIDEDDVPTETETEPNTEKKDDNEPKS